METRKDWWIGSRSTGWHVENGIPVITPNYAKTTRKGIRQNFEAAREHIAEARKLRATGYAYDRELADGVLGMASSAHESARKWLRFLAVARIEKYSNISPNAAARLSQ